MSRIKYVLCNLYLLNSRYRRIHKNPMHIAYLSMDILHLTCVEKTPSFVYVHLEIETFANKSQHFLPVVSQFSLLKRQNLLLFIGNGDVSNMSEKFSSGTKKSIQTNKTIDISLLKNILMCVNFISSQISDIEARYDRC